MSSFKSQLAGRVQRALRSSKSAAYLAVKLKNQCELVLGGYLATSNVHEDSGEGWLIEQLAPASKNFVDVGANVGDWALAFASKMETPNGILFEPNPHTAQRLRSVLQTQGLGALQVIEAAVSDYAGTAHFFAEDGFGETSSLYSSSLRTRADKIEVQLVRLDDELGARNIDKVDVLKVDAEGHDLFALLGAQEALKAQKIQVVQFEYNAPWADAGGTLARAYQLLESNGYKVRLLKGPALYTLDRAKVGEYFKYSNFVAYCPGPLGALLDQKVVGAIL